MSQGQGGGRPTAYTEETASKILEEIGTTLKGLAEICSPNEMPSERTVYRWLASDEKFRHKYAHAKELQTEVMEAEMLEIADDGRNDYMTRKYGDLEVEIANPEVIGRSRLRIETRKWLMGKLKPKKYGERLDLNHSGSIDITDKLKEARDRASNRV